MSAPDALPCPFCGNVPMIHAPLVVHDRPTGGIVAPASHWVLSCEKKECIAPLAVAVSREALLEVWNRRAVPPAKEKSDA